jgi:hypothetical protein
MDDDDYDDDDYDDDDRDDDGRDDIYIDDDQELDDDYVCAFLLLGPYQDCSTFHIAQHACPSKECAMKCSTEEWCYFGAIASEVCFNYFYKETLWDQTLNTTAVVEITDMCVASAAAQAAEVEIDDDADDRFSGLFGSNETLFGLNSFTHGEIVEIVVFVVLSVVVLVSGMTYYFKDTLCSGRESVQHRRLLTLDDSQHNTGISVQQYSDHSNASSAGSQGQKKSLSKKDKKSRRGDDEEIEITLAPMHASL